MNITDYEPEPTCQIPGLTGLYAATFGLKNNGTFVEVGAYDGKTYSNTFQLARLGWDGIYVEPEEESYRRCAGNHKEHPKITTINAFISATTGEDVSLAKSDVGMTTGNYDFAKLFKADKSLQFPYKSLSLGDLLGIYPEIRPGFELLVIDVEGHEIEVLKGSEGEQ